MNQKINHMAKELTPREFDYLDGLVKSKQAEAFDNAVKNFIIDLTEEGFDMDDVKQYIRERESRIFFAFRNYDKEE